MLLYSYHRPIIRTFKIYVTPLLMVDGSHSDQIYPTPPLYPSAYPLSRELDTFDSTGQPRRNNNPLDKTRANASYFLI